VNQQQQQQQQQQAEERTEFFSGVWGDPKAPCNLCLIKNNIAKVTSSK
jgi:hypothetical protein